MKNIIDVCGTTPKLIMFDLDGTLVDSVPDLAAAVDQMLLQIGREKAGVDMVSQWVGNGAEMLVRRALSRSMEIDLIEDELFQEAYHSFLEAYKECSGTQSELYPDVAAVLALLRQKVNHLAVVTNKPAQFTAVLLDKLGLNDFDLVISGDSLSTKKPDPAPLIHCLETFDCSPEDALMVGDSSSDIKAAKAASVPSICVSYGYNQGVDLRSLKPNLVIDSFSELIEVYE